jgi:hypothetical protein
MAGPGEIDTSIYKEAANADPFEFQNKLIGNYQELQKVQEPARPPIGQRRCPLEAEKRGFG